MPHGGHKKKSLSNGNGGSRPCLSGTQSADGSVRRPGTPQSMHCNQRRRLWQSHLRLPPLQRLRLPPLQRLRLPCCHDRIIPGGQVGAKRPLTVSCMSQCQTAAMASCLSRKSAVSVRTSASPAGGLAAAATAGFVATGGYAGANANAGASDA